MEQRDDLELRDSRIEDAYRDGATVREVAEAFGMSRQRVYQVLAERGVQLTPRPRRAREVPALRDEEREAALRMRADGVSFRVIAERLGTTVERVREAVQSASSEEVQEAIRGAG